VQVLLLDKEVILVPELLQDKEVIRVPELLLDKEVIQVLELHLDKEVTLVLELLQDKEVTLVVVEPDQVTQEDQEDQEDILRDSHMEEGHHRLPEPGRHQDRAMEEVEVEEVIPRAKDKWIPKLLSGLTL